MPQASAVFSLQAFSNPDNWGHGGAVFSGGVEAAASLHRGLDLSAEVDLETRLSGVLQKAVVANVTAGGQADAGVTLEAAFPIDLFQQAGVVAKAEARAEAAAWIEATVGLDVGFFESMLSGSMQGIWLNLLDIFLGELTVSAGVWAEASFSAEIWAEASFVGNLITLDDGTTPGFTFSCGYGAGWGCGAGADLIVNLGITDPARMLNRLADRISSELEGEVQTLVSGLPAQAAADAKRGLAFLNIVLPLAMRTAFEAGVSLVSSDPGSSDKTTAIARSFLREAQEAVLKSAVDLATTSLGGRLTALFDAVSSFAPPDEAQVSNAIDSAIDSINQLEGFDISDPDSWYPAITSVANALVGLSETPLLSGTDASGFRDDLALFWSAATLVRRIVSWLASSDANSAGDSPNPFDATSVPSGADSALISYIAAQPIFGPQGNAPKSAGASLTYADLVAFILADNTTRGTIEAIEAQLPEIAPAIQWVQTTCAALGGTDALSFLLGDATSFLSGDTSQACSAIGSAVSNAVNQEIVPKLLSSLVNSSDPATADIACRVIRPTVLALSEIILPNIVNVKDDDGAQVLREQISAVLLQFLTRFAITSVDLVSQKGFDDGASYLRGLAADVRQNGLQGRAGGLEQLCAGLPSLAPTNDDYAEMIDLLSDALTQFNLNIRGQALEVIESVVTFALFTDNTMAQVYALENPDSPSDPEGLSDLVNALQDGLWTSLQVLVPEGVAIVENYLEGVGQQVEVFITNGVKDVIAAIEQAIQWIEQQIQNLEQAIGDAERDILTQTANVSSAVANLATEAIALEQQVLDSLQAYGWSLVQPLLNGMPDAVTGAAQGIYDGLFSDAEALLEAPLDILCDVAQWIHDEALAELQSGTLSPENIISNVSQQIMAAITSDLTIPISVTVDVTLGDSFFGYYTVSQTFNLGTITIPGGSILSSISGAVFGDANILGFIDSIVSYLKALQSDQIQVASGQAQAANMQGQLSAPQIVTGEALVASIDSPAGGSQWDLVAPVSIAISGADATFFTETQGVAPRARIYLNGAEVDYSADEWVPNGGDFVFTASVASSSTGLVPQVLRLSNAAQMGRARRRVLPGAKRKLAVRKTRAKRVTAALVRVARPKGRSPRIAGILSSAPMPPLAAINAGQRWLLPPLALASSGFEQIDPDPPDQSAPPSQGRVLVGVAGLNSVQVVIVDGQGQQAQEVATFTLRNSNALPHKLYAGVYSSSTSGTKLVPGLNADDFVATWRSMSGQGMRLNEIETYTAAGQRYWTGLFVPGTDAYILLIGLALGDLVAKCTALGAQGLQLVSFCPYDDGELLWAGVWRQGTGAGQLFCGDWPSFSAKFSSLGARGFRVTSMKTYLDPSGTRMWAGLWRPGSGLYFLQANYDWPTFQAKHAELSASGLSLATFATYTDGDQRLFGGSWLASGATTKLCPGLGLAGIQAQMVTFASAGLGLSDLVVFPGYL